jgi:hypothetical protein
MIDVPKRIWVVFSGGDGYEEEIWLSPADPSVPDELRGTEYLCADLLPTIEDLVDMIAIEEDAYKLAESILKRIRGEE